MDAAAIGYPRTAAGEAITHAQFEAFYARTVMALRGYVRRIAGNAAMVDDILQESYIRLLTAPPLGEDQRQAYLYRTATNLVTDYYRSQVRRRHWWERAAPVVEAADPGMDLASDLERLFALLTPQERALLWLAYVEGAAHRDIAEILQLKEKSVKVLLFRARHKMEAILKAHGFEGSHE